MPDTEKKTVDAYGSLNERGMASRNTFLIGPNGKIAKVWTAVKPQHQSEEVLEALCYRVVLQLFGLDKTFYFDP